MAASDLSQVLDKLRSLETKMTTIQRELSAVKHGLRFPEYDGTTDPDSWLHRCQLFFRLQRTEDDEKVWLAGYHMTGKAQIWYCWLERNYCVSTKWSQFTEDVRRRKLGGQTSGKPANLLLRDYL